MQPLRAVSSFPFRFALVAHLTAGGTIRPAGYVGPAWIVAAVGTEMLHIRTGSACIHCHLEASYVVRFKWTKT